MKRLISLCVLLTAVSLSGGQRDIKKIKFRAKWAGERSAKMCDITAATWDTLGPNTDKIMIEVSFITNQIVPVCTFSGPKTKKIKDKEGATFQDGKIHITASSSDLCKVNVTRFSREDFGVWNFSAEIAETGEVISSEHTLDKIQVPCELIDKVIPPPPNGTDELCGRKTPDWTLPRCGDEFEFWMSDTQGTPPDFCYKWMDTWMSWAEAYRSCQSMDAHLASIQTGAEAEFLLQRIPFRMKYWIDGRRIGEGEWIWTDGTRMRDCYEGFCNNNNNSPKSNCLHMGNCYKNEKKCFDWEHSIECQTELQGYICKKRKNPCVDSKCPKP